MNKKLFNLDEIKSKKLEKNQNYKFLIDLIEIHNKD